MRGGIGARRHTMVFSPLSSTVMMATPVVPLRRATASRSTPAGISSLSATLPMSSSPIAPTIRTGAPARRAASAWLAPLPPGIRA
jgi:hypothetical protein